MSKNTSAPMGVLNGSNKTTGNGNTIPNDEIAPNLSQKSVDVNLQLQNALLQNNFNQIIQLVRQNKVDLNGPIDQNGNTLLLWAIDRQPSYSSQSADSHFECKKLVELLIKNANPDLANNYGVTPLNVAVKKEYDYAIEQLVETNKVDVNQRINENGDTLLIWEARRWGIRMLEIS